MHEKLLLVRLRKKDPEAFAQIYDKYVEPLYRYIYFKVASQQDAEDLTSEVFIKMYNYIAEQQNRVNNLRALLYQIARNLVIDFYRKKAKADVVREEEVLLNIKDDRQQSFFKTVEIASEIEQVENSLRKIKDEYREIIILKYIEELSIKEIADILNKSQGAVRVLIHRALKVARDVLQNTTTNEQHDRTTKEA